MNTVQIAHALDKVCSAERNGRCVLQRQQLQLLVGAPLDYSLVSRIISEASKLGLLVMAETDRFIIIRKSIVEQWSTVSDKLLENFKRQYEDNPAIAK